MASLKEIKGRINSVNGTLKITSAMKMVASSKLHKVQGVIANMIPYEQEMHRILYRLLSDGSAPSCTEYVSSRPVKRVAVVAVASNTALCGAFNANAIRHFRETVDEYFQAGLSKEDIDVYAVGKKMSDAAERDGFNLKGDFGRLADRHVYADVSAFAKILIDSWLNREVDRIELVYNHYSSSASQSPVRETYLPFRNPSDEAQRKDGEEGKQQQKRARKEIAAPRAPPHAEGELRAESPLLFGRGDERFGHAAAFFYEGIHFRRILKRYAEGGGELLRLVGE